MGETAESAGWHSCDLLSRFALSGMICDMGNLEIVFSVTQEADGGFVAECLSHDIFTQGNNWEELRSNVREAISAYFFDQPNLTVFGCTSSETKSLRPHEAASRPERRSTR